jgi:hypothetical protein
MQRLTMWGVVARNRIANQHHAADKTKAGTSRLQRPVDHHLWSVTAGKLVLARDQERRDGSKG